MNDQRIPPHSLDAEQSVLGAMMLDSGAADKASSALQATDFYHPANKEIFIAMMHLYEEKRPIDLVTLDNELTRRGVLESVGGAGYLVDISQYVPTTANISAYVQIVKDHSLRRRAIQECADTSHKLFSRAMSPADVLDIHGLAVKILLSGTGGGAVSMEQAITRFNAEMINKQTEQGQRRAWTGIPTLDAKLGGIRGGKLVTIGARTGVGKSAFALATALATCKSGQRTLFVSLEMTAVEILTRIAAQYSGVPVDEIERGGLSDERITAIVGTYGRMAQNKIDFCHENIRTVLDVRHEAYQAHAKGDLGLVVVDYIGLLRSGEKTENRRVEIGQITRQLRILASELKVPVLACSQLNRVSEGGTDRAGKKIARRPTMAELRESGDVEQDSNIIMLLHRPEEGETAEEQKAIDDCRNKGMDYVSIIVEKNRQGRRGVFPVAFDGARMRYHRLKEGMA